MKKFLVVGPMCWGKGDTCKEAMKNAVKNLSSLNSGIDPSKVAFRAYLTDETTDVTAMGGLSYRKDLGEPVLIGQFNIKGKELSIEQGVKDAADPKKAEV